MQQIISNCEERMKKCVASLQLEYQNLRTGRASTALFDKIKVDYYGAETPLNQVASLSVPEARLVVRKQFRNPSSDLIRTMMESLSE